MKNRTQKHEKKQDMDADSTPRRKQKQNKRSAIYSFHIGIEEWRTAIIQATTLGLL
jgi:hypothetical protein